MAANQGIKTQTLFIAIVVSFALGFMAGAGFAIYRGASNTSGEANTATGVQSVASDQQTSEITNLEARVTAEPKNFQLWTELGNRYYDTGQPEKAIEAYKHSLELHSGDANIYTDLGVMYRRIGQPAKAIEYFDRAIAQDPKHEPSRLNKGIVLAYDLHQPQKAIEVWEKLLSIDPDARTARGDAVRDLIKQLKRQQEGKK